MVLGAEGHHDVQSLTAGCLDPALEIASLQQRSQTTSGSTHFAPCYSLPRIDVEDDPIGMFDILHTRVPGVKLDHAGIDQGEQVRSGFDVAVFANFPLLLDLDARNGLRYKPLIACGVMHELRLRPQRIVPGYWCRHADQRQRAPLDMRERPISNLFIKCDEIASPHRNAWKDRRRISGRELSFSLAMHVAR